MPKNRCPLVAASTLFYAFLVCTAASVATEAHADPDFIGFDAEYTFNDQNNYVITVYAVFDNADAVVGNVFNSDIAVSASGFIHNDVFVGAGGTWQPSASIDIPNLSDSGNDSYVTIGYGVGAVAALNGTALDPGFGSGLGGTIPVGAGWFNGNPPNEQVVVPFFGGLDGLSGFAGKVGQFVIDPATSSSGALSFSFDAEIGSNVGAESEYVFGQDLIFVNIQNTDSDGDGIPDEFDPCPTWPGDCSEDGQTLFVGSDDGADAIQLALTAVPEGGTVRVGPGTYAGPIDFAGKAVTLEATPDPQAGSAGAVILDGTGLEGSIVLAISGEGPDTVLRGFVLQNGISGSDPIAPTSWDYTVAGALYVHASSPTIEDCVFRNCAAGSAGAAYFFDSESVVSGCSFFDNVSGRSGGGLQLQVSNLTVEDCVFTGNQAAVFGGAIHNWSGSSSFIGCTITGNTSNEVGGGMSFFWNSSTTGNGTIENCVITDNTALVEGGGLMLSTSEGITPDWLLVGNTTLCNNTPENTNSNATAPFVDLGGNCISEFCDSISNGTRDCDDGCPYDPNKTEPGDCGCGVADTDTDGDGILDCDDPCPSWPYDCSEDGQTFFVGSDDGADAIQLALTAVPEGGTVQVGPGTYLLNATIDTNGKAVTIRGAVDPVTGETTTILDGQGARRVLQCLSGEGADTVFEDLVIRGGYATGDFPDSAGGGMYNNESSPTLTNCTFTNNSADYGGGGMYNSSTSSPTLTDCTFTDNSADYGGGSGMYNYESSPTLTDCTFTYNTTEGSGVMYNNSSSPTLTNCTFTDNSAEGSGGGMRNSSSSPTLTDCTFTNNSADYDGGGMYNYSSSPTLTDCTFTNNSAADDGGGMCNYNNSSPTLNDCTFTDNSAGFDGGGMWNYISSSPTLTDCTFTNNSAGSGGGMYTTSNSSPILANTTVCENTPDQISGTITDNGGNCISDVCDSDLDGTRDCDDGCPDDPAKTEPGDCGCGVAETDTDGDGIPDCIDPCPTWPGDCSEDGQTLFVGSDDGADAIQLALTIIPQGGTILVGPGTYAGPIDFAGKAVTLEATPDRQAGSAGEVILDGAGLEGSIVLAISGEGPDTVLRGFVLQNGITGSDPIAPSSWDYTVAGALYVHASSPTIENCVFRNCAAGSAGAAYFFDSESVVSGCSFFDNVSGRSGGGLQLQVSNLTVEDCVFTGNQAAKFGGAIHNWSGASSFIGCTITGNTSNEVGGGMSFFWNSSTTGNGTIENCVITDNTALIEGGGLMLSTSEGITPDWLLVGNTTLCNNTPENTNANATAPFVDLGGNCISEFCDSDSDGTRDCDDGCPDDPNKTEPGDCGCGVADTDTDGDGILDCNDPCPTWPYDCSQGDQAFYVTTVDGPAALQLAINVIPETWTIDVGPGTYLLNATIDTNGKAVTIRGAVDPVTGDSLTVLDGQGTRRVLQCLSGEGPDTVFEDLVIRGGNATGVSPNNRGGGMHNINSSPTLNNCTFTNNSASSGGGMYNYESSPTLTDCTFTDNSAEVYGGGMYINNSSPTLTDCTFTDNSAGNVGGGMRNYESSPTLTDCTFTNNSAENSGGGMCNLRSSPTLTNCSFANNSADYGGGMNNYESFPTLTDCTFTDNSAEVYGGGMYINNSSPTLTDCTFTDNSAEFYGGGMYINNSSPTLTDCTFTDNSAGTSGGGMYNYESFPTLTNCSFANNSADYGGGMYNLRSSPTLTDCTFTDNSAGTSGGGMYNYESFPTLTNCSFANNSASYGSGMYNVVSSPTLNNCTFTNNSASSGGGMRNSSSSPTLTDCTFTNNSADVYGGGMDNFNSSSPTLTNCTFTDNSADYGGGMSNYDNSSPTLTNCTFTNNSADVYGGGMDNINSSPTLNNCTFTNNSASSGGGMYNINSSPILNNTTVCENTPDQISGTYTDNGGNCISDVCDSDLDGTRDCDDGCPDDPNKTEPGDCGCSVADTDTDGDGIPDCIDPCPTWPGDCSEDGQTLFVGSDDGADAIQLALTIIPQGGTISVGPGTYAGPIDFAGKAVTLEATPDRQAGPDGEVVLDGTGLQGSIVLAISGEGPDTVLRGFVLQNGITGSDPIAPTSWDYTVGGALYVHESSPTIEGCVFRNCAAGSAGAAFFFLSDSVVSGCSFFDNVSGRSGGGLQLQVSNLTVEDCVFTGNQAAVFGGAIHNWSGSSSFIGCTITENTSLDVGGGMSFFWSTSTTGNGIVEDCVITRNEAAVEGGGLMLSTDEGITPDWLLVGNTTLCNNTPENTNSNATAPFVDLGGNQICGCPGDVNFDAQVDGQDLAVLLSNWGACTSDDPTACFADINGDGVVGGPDLTIILSRWGVCVN